MLFRSFILGGALALALAGAVRADDAPDQAAPDNSMMMKNEAPVAARLKPEVSAYKEHAPLAWFSLGSLAVGGVFYAISEGMDHPNVAYTTSDRSHLNTTVTVAGISALLAAGSYLYYAHRAAQREAEPESESAWDAGVTGGLDADGNVTMGARLTLPLPGPL